jgi:hypothetical protein
MPPHPPDEVAEELELQPPPELPTAGGGGMNRDLPRAVLVDERIDTGGHTPAPRRRVRY